MWDSHFAQEYVTTLESIKNRFSAGKIDKITVSLYGVQINITEPTNFDTYKDNVTIKVREDRFVYDDDSEDRHVQIHHDIFNPKSEYKLDGTL